MGKETPEHASEWHELAQVRARDLRPRALFSVLVAVCAGLTVGGPWPWLWLLATLAAQLASVAVIEPARREPGFAVTPARRRLFYAALAGSSTVFAASAVIFWFGGGAPGRLFAVIVLAGGIVNVALQAGSSVRQLWISCAPFALLLQILPLVSLAMARPGDREVLSLTAFGATLILFHLVAAAHRMVDNTRRLRAALEEAQRERLRAEGASAAKSDFLGVMSHELRTPLNGVLGMAQALAAESLTQDQHEKVDVIRRSGESLLILLNDLLDISKLETSRLVMESGVVELTALAAQAQAVFGPIAAAKGLSFDVRMDKSAGDARRGDPMRVRQLLHNLVGNALKFTDKGGVSVRLSGAADQLILEVADTGPGIAPEDQTQLFERFSLSDGSATRRHGGSGIGLAIVRGLARLMGGDVSVRSAPGEGSVFTAHLSLPEASPAAPEPEAHPGLALQTRLRVLAAEDNPTNQLVLRTLLEQLGVAVHLVEDGEAAVAACRDAAWDLILMDVQMPRMDGLAAARAIRALEADERRGRTPIIAVTANANGQQAEEYRAAGVDGVAPKPIQLSQLLGVINEVTDELARAAPRHRVA